MTNITEALNHTLSTISGKQTFLFKLKKSFSDLIKK